MRFCKFCGSQLADDAVCNCPGAMAERQAAGAEQPRQQGEKSFAQKLLEPLKLYFKDPKKAVDNRIKEKDFITAFIYIGALFVIMLAEKACVYGAEAFTGRPYIAFNFGLVLLSALLSVTGLCAVYVGARFVILAVVGKKPFNAVNTLMNSLISFGVNSLVPMGLILLGGLFYLLADGVGMVFFLLAAVWYVAAGILEIKDDLSDSANPFFKLMMVAVTIGVSVVLYYFLYKGMYAMNVRMVDFSGSYAADLSRYFNY